MTSRPEGWYWVRVARDGAEGEWFVAKLDRLPDDGTGERETWTVCGAETGWDTGELEIGPKLEPPPSPP